MIISKFNHTIILCILTLIYNILLINYCKAQIWKNDSDLGSFLVGVEASKVLEFGAFGPYLGPEIRKNVDNFFGRNNKTGQSKSGVSSSQLQHGFLRTILPSGKLPTDGKFSYDGGLGHKFLIGFEPEAFRRADGNGLILSAFYLQDRNTIKFYAPSGLGIFTDPTSLTGSVKARLIGFEAKAPIWSTPSSDGLHSIFGSMGYARVTTETMAKASSVFLDIHLSQKSIFWTPLFSAEYNYKPNDAALNMLLAQLKLSMYKSQNMYSGIFSLSLMFNF